MRGDSPALTAARCLVDDLQSWQTGRTRWTDLSRSLLFYGPPGTGKTWLARAMGNSAGIAMVTGSFAEWQAAGHLGDMLRAMRQAFAEARRQTPAMLFVDEIDAVGSREDGDRHGSSYRLQVINAFLAEMDSIAREEGVIVVGACNDPSRIDPAVLRQGRFDLRIAVPLPDSSAIQGILEHHLGNSFQEGELTNLAITCIGQSAAAIDAAIRAARSEARHTGQALTPELIRRQLGIADSTDSQVRDGLDRRIALHECGHALVAAALDRGQPTRILITPEGGEIHRGDATHGACLADHLAELTVLMAGRAAEGLILGEISSGAGGSDGSDLARATSLALEIETQSGLGVMGPVWSDTPAAIALREPAIHQRIRQRLEEAERAASVILTAHRALLQRMASDLQHHRELAGAELMSWLAQVMPGSRDGDDPARQVAATSDGSLDAPAGGSETAQPDGPQGASVVGRQSESWQASPDGSRRACAGDISHRQQAHPDHQGDPHDRQDSPEVEQGSPDPNQAI